MSRPTASGFTGHSSTFTCRLYKVLCKAFDTYASYILQHPTQVLTIKDILIVYNPHNFEAFWEEMEDHDEYEQGFEVLYFLW